MLGRNDRCEPLASLPDSERQIETDSRRQLAISAPMRAVTLVLAVLAFTLTQISNGAMQSPANTHKPSPEELKRTHAVPLTSVPEGRPVPVYGPIRARAIASRNNGASTVQEFVDEVFRQTGFDSAAPSLRHRIATAELAYRQGCHPPIELLEFVKGMNAAATKLSLPDFFKTSTAQVRLQQLYATVLAPGAWDEREGEAMAPSQAAFVVLFLTYQKFWNRGYQTDPDRWASQQRALMANNPDPAFLRLQRRPETRPDLARDYVYLRTELAQENSEVTRTAHDLFDRVGIAR